MNETASQIRLIVTARFALWEAKKMKKERQYICIDLKSFYASVECVERGFDPMTTNLVVADAERTEKTICLAVSPSMKARGIPGRCRVFEIPAGIPYIMATPRMQLYIDYSAEIYAIYLRYISGEDIHVYSIDEVFMDVTGYLSMYGMSARELAAVIMRDIRETTGIPAAAGVGTNLYLAKIALDIIAKRSPDFIGVLDEESYRRLLWRHRPLTDFWRIGRGTAERLARIGVFTMEEVAAADERVLYKLFGVDAELLIDHAWGREPVTMADIKAYRPREHCISNGQVLPRDYLFEEGALIVREMADVLCLELTEKRLVTDSITLHVSYMRKSGRKSAHGTIALPAATDLSRRIIDHAEKLYRQIVDENTPIRRVSLTYNHVNRDRYCQYDFFTSPDQMEKERQMQRAVLDIKRRFGKNAVLKGMDFQEGATTIERNGQIGGHRSGA